MKSYLRFLSRNKLYTAIEIIGLSIALGFIIILSAYVIDEFSTDPQVKNKSKLWVCHNKGIATSSQKFDKIFDATPEILDYCQFTDSEAPIYIKANDLSYSEKPLYVSSNFFEFMGYELVAGDASTLWENEKSVVISERFAHNMYPGMHAVGRTFTFTDNDENEEAIWNTFTITGVYRNPEKSMVMDSDIILNMNCLPNMDTPGFDIGSGNLLRLAPDTDHEKLCERLYKDAAGNGMVLYEADLTEPLLLTAFSDMDINVAKLGTKPFINLTDKKVMKTFMIACLIILGFAILNYISLTIAFSRFRNKEMATRRILGTSKGLLTFRSFIESCCFTSISFIIGVALALTVQNKASVLLGKEIEIFSSPAEIIWSAILIILLSIVTALVPAFISSKVKPISIIKGEERYKDKMILGKSFIFIQTFVSMVCICTASAYWLQTRKMLDTPLGYRMENVISIRGIQHQIPVTLESLPFIKRVGRSMYTPIDGAAMKTSRKLADETLTFNVTICDSSALSVLGIEMTEIFKSERVGSKVYVTESSAQWMRNLCSAKGISEDHIKDICDGVISEMRFGNHTTATEGITAIIVQENKRMSNYIVEVEGDVQDAKRKIKEYLYNIDTRPYFHGYQVRFSPEIKTMKELVEDSYHKEKDSIILIGIFALLCMMLTAIAIIALSGHYAQLNRHDTAVRKVFGISRRKVYWMTLWGFAAPVLAGAIVAIPLAYLYIGTWLTKYPVRIENTTLIYITSLSIIVAVVIVSISTQAASLMRTNPASELKKE